MKTGSVRRYTKCKVLERFGNFNVICDGEFHITVRNGDISDNKVLECTIPIGVKRCTCIKEQILVPADVISKCTLMCS